MDPLEAAEQAVAQAESRVEELAVSLSGERAAAAPAFGEAVAAELQGLGMGDGEFRADVEPRDPGATGRDGVSFLIRPNAGMPLAWSAMSFEPRQPIHGPRHHVRMSSCVCSHISYGGIDQVASSRRSEVSDSMSYRSNAST